MRRSTRSAPKPPTLLDFPVCIEVPADSALAARALVAEVVLSGGANLTTDHPAMAFFAAWDKEIALAREALVEAQEDYAERQKAWTARKEAAGARDFLLAVMKGEATATETQIAAAEALVRAL